MCKEDFKEGYKEDFIEDCNEGLLQAMTSRAFLLRVGFDQKARVSGSGIWHIMV